MMNNNSQAVSNYMPPKGQAQAPTEIQTQLQTQKDVVQAITEVVSEIRSIDAFIPSLPHPKDILRDKIREGEGKESEMQQEEVVYIYKSIEENSLLISKINRLKKLKSFVSEDQRIPSLLDDGNSDGSSSSNSSIGSSRVSIHNNDNHLHQHPLEKDRYDLVHKIFLPLMTCLAETYAILDNNVMMNETENKNENKNDSNNNQSNDEEEKRGKVVKGKRRKKKPQAPDGLLSITNYTDIASLLEIAVCTSIVPLLESYILLDIKDRIQQSLPKSLCGRIRKKSLYWGMDVLNYTKKWEEMEKKQKQSKQQQKQQQQSSSQMIKIQRLHNAIQKIQKAKMELSLVSNALSQIILLDRFRPMILPRHATDVYAVLFQLERLDDLEKKLSSSLVSLKNSSLSSSSKVNEIGLKNHSNQKITSSEQKNMIHWIHHVFLLHNNVSETPSSLTYCQYHLIHNVQPIDIYTKVKSFQSLLLSGKKTPLWLKRRVGMLLTNIATTSSSSSCDSIEGIQSIIDVFVVAASLLPTEEITGASFRLGKALCVIDERDDQVYYQLLLSQFIKLLDHLQQEYKQDASIGADFTGGNGNINNDIEMNSRTVGTILTIWAVLEQMSKQTLTKYFLSELVQGLLPPSNTKKTTMKTSASAKISIGRIRLLLMYTPPGNVNPNHILNRFCQFMLSDSFLIQHDTTYSNEFRSTATSSPGIISPFGQILRVACSEKKKIVQYNVFRMASDTLRMIIYTIISKCHIEIPNNNDKIEYSSEKCIAAALLHSVSMNSFDLSHFEFHRQGTTLNEDEMIFETVNNNDNMEINLITAMEERTKFVIETLVDDKGEMNKLPSEMFRLLLLIYFESNQISDKNKSVFYLPQQIRMKLDEYKIASMMMLPLLCERCSPVSLFMDNGSNSNGVTQIIILIISTISKKFGNHTDGNHASNKGGDDSETQLSIASIVLSLLVAMLELGSEKRSEREENDLKAMLPSLQTLTKLTETSFQNPNNSKEDEESSKPLLKSEIAEMSSHAMVIILARSAPSEAVADDNTLKNMSNVEFIKKTVSDVETQLLSDQPPLRARAVVQLRQLARGPLEELRRSSKSKQKPTTSLITELNDDNTPVSVSDLESPCYLVEDMLRVCIKSLDDSESYVYLASIQTIVSIADVFPIHAMPILVEAVTSGQVRFSSHLSSLQKLDLSSAQRIKITEALMFTIRRRGDAIRNYFDLLMNSILYGKNSIGKDISNRRGHISSSNIQRETEVYFRGNKDHKEELNEYAISSDTTEERELRVNTGGPVFDAEENDVVRAACISVVADLVSTMHPAAVEPYCCILMKLGVNALRLDHSRVVRRPAALLCRELYSCALREFGDNFESLNATDARFTITLVQSGEDLLLSTLKRCISGDDVNLSSSSTGLVSSVKGKMRLYDPATVARCEEALHVRKTLCESGLMGVIELYIKSQDQDSRAPISRLLKKEMGQSTSKSLLQDLSL